MIDPAKSNPKNIIGSFMNRLSYERSTMKKKAVDEIWANHGLKDEKLRGGFKLAETTTVQADGVEVTEYRLYRLIGSSRVTIAADITTKIETDIATTYGGETTKQDN